MNVEHLRGLIQKLKKGLVIKPNRWSGDTPADDPSGGVDIEATEKIMKDSAEELQRILNIVFQVDDFLLGWKILAKNDNYKEALYLYCKFQDDYACYFSEKKMIKAGEYGIHRITYDDVYDIEDYGPIIGKLTLSNDVKKEDLLQILYDTGIVSKTLINLIGVHIEEVNSNVYEIQDRTNMTLFRIKEYNGGYENELTKEERDRI